MLYQTQRRIIYGQTIRENLAGIVRVGMGVEGGGKRGDSFPVAQLYHQEQFVKSLSGITPKDYPRETDAYV